MEQKLARWAQARENRDFAVADIIRAELRASGVDPAQAQIALANGRAPVTGSFSTPPDHGEGQKRLCKKWA
eukprot:4295939-Prymnesium_polylepis.1